MAEIDQRPRCPKCGEPARTVKELAYVRIALELDGKPGSRVESAKVAMLPLLSDTMKAFPSEYECGGGHTWNPKG